MQDAQQSIKASMSANAEESLASTENVDSKDDLKRESSKRKGPFLCFFITGFFFIFVNIYVYVESLILITLNANLHANVMMLIITRAQQ